MNVPERSDHELFNQIDQGRDEAFGALLAKHYDTLFAFAFKYCRCRSNAEDILQESLLKISRNFHRFDRRHRFTTWAYRIVINTAKDLFEKERRERIKQQAFAEEIVQSTAPDPLHEGLWELLDRLPQKLYDAVTLVYGQGLNHAEAATALGCAETTVSWRLYQARKKLTHQARRLGLVLLVFLFGGERWTR
ncbi:MAG: RNA polymerase sigma factor [Proteobacteria bacterium]|nr:RNA polymerase sigma factor [Pseudomonadota bacterium]MBU1687847.1 RNA polymerase sigma factor [Pseudomonadota bacterium]